MSKPDSVGDNFTEKKEVEVDVLTVTDISDKDEALNLVGLERTRSFTEEEYKRVRRKLVSVLIFIPQSRN